MDNKHQAMLDYLAKYPGLDAFLRFNSVTDKLEMSAFRRCPAASGKSAT